MVLPAVFFIVLLLSSVSSLRAACPDGKYCPVGTDCDISSTSCRSSICTIGGNFNILENRTDDCEEGKLDGIKRLNCAWEV